MPFEADNNQLLKVPEQFSKILLPNERLSISVFLEYPLPAIASASIPVNVPLENFFDVAEPLECVELAKLVKQPLPPANIIKELVRSLPKQVSAGKQSMRCMHHGTFGLNRLPFWVLGYWVKVLEYRKIMAEWLRADSWVRNCSRMKDDEDQDIVNEVLEMFTLLPWSGTLCGIDWDMSIQALATFLGTKWLSTDHMDLLLHATRRRLSRKFDVLRKYQLQELGFINKLISAYQTDSKIPARMHKVTADLASGQCHGIGGYANVHGNHWVTWAVKPEDWTIYFGDGTGNSLDKDLEGALTLWLQPYARQEISLKKMKITAQLDSHSCGILSDNALEHFFSPDVPLITQGRIPILRCKSFLEICKRHLAMRFTDDEESNNDATTVFPFTFSSPSPKEEGQSSKRKVIPSPCGSPTNSPVKKKQHSPENITSKPQNGNGLDTSPGALDVFGPIQTNFTSLSGESSVQSKTGTLLSFFKKFDKREEYEDYLRQSMISYKEEKTNIQQVLSERKEAEETRRKSHIRETNLIRQRRKRQREHEVKEELAKKACTLPLRDDKSDSVMPNLPEKSRPYREFRNDARKHQKRKRTGWKSTNDETPVPAVRTNWLTPFLWEQIVWAGKQCKPNMRASEIVRLLHLKWPLLFGRLTTQVVGRWIDRSRTPKWSDHVLKVAEKGNRPQSHSKRAGILKPYPELVERIMNHLKSLRNAGAPLSLVTVRGIMVAHFEHFAPEIFDMKFNNGETFLFRCTDSFVKKFLHEELEWTPRKATGNARKLPPDWEQICYKAALRIGWVIKEEDIPADLFVNTDQTGITYSQGSELTWAQVGSKQVTVAGHDEKRAFTLAVSISCNGTLLPLQAIYRGKSPMSCPSKDAPWLKEAEAAGIKFTFSGKDNHWSSYKTMHELVNEIISPYFETAKKKLGRPAQQKSIWLIDCWTVHRSQEFLDWMREHHPNIVVLFVPANCTGVFQPCDVGIQRPLKLSVKRCSHEDVVHEVSAGLADAEGPPHEVKITKSLPILHDRSVRWVYTIYETLNRPELVKKSFELCQAKGINLSYETLASYSFRQMLRDLPQTDPDFHRELLIPRATCELSEEIPEDMVILEDDLDLPETFDDESSLPLQALLTKALGEKSNMEGAIEDDNGNYISLFGVAESSTEQPSTEPPVSEELGRGKRPRKPATRFADKRFWEEH